MSKVIKDGGKFIVRKIKAQRLKKSLKNLILNDIEIARKAVEPPKPEYLPGVGIIVPSPDGLFKVIDQSSNLVESGEDETMKLKEKLLIRKGEHVC
jgi:hypothetical protein